MGIGKDKLNTNINPPFVFSFWPCDFHGVLSFHKCARKTGGIKRNVMLTIENWIQRNKEIWWKVGRKSVLATCFFFFYSWRIFSILHVTRETRRVLTEGRHTHARARKLETRSRRSDSRTNESEDILYLHDYQSELFPRVSSSTADRFRPQRARLLSGCAPSSWLQCLSKQRRLESWRASSNIISNGCSLPFPNTFKLEF